ncbi:hypothetical protein SAMN04487979_102248 [Flavobacterium sp. ov086]|nr:hypothetical protein SAMN04487979_102248 [Flavobacterium sp. ov086]
MQSIILPANLIKTSSCNGILLYLKATLFVKYNGIDQTIGFIVKNLLATKDRNMDYKKLPKSI